MLSRSTASQGFSFDGVGFHQDSPFGCQRGMELLFAKAGRIEWLLSMRFPGCRRDFYCPIVAAKERLSDSDKSRADVSTAPCIFLALLNETLCCSPG